jgi:hypothetical protein
MPALSGFFRRQGARGADGAPPPRLQFTNKSGTYSYVTAVPNPATNGFSYNPTPVVLGTKIVLDFGSIEAGPLRFKPFDDSRLRPYIDFASVPPMPDEKDYNMAVRLQVLLPVFGLAQWTLGGPLAQNTVLNVYNRYLYAQEAARGMIPVCTLRPCKQVPVASRNNEMFNVPVLEPIGYVPRDEGIYGPRTVPPPIPVIAAPPPQPTLPPQAAAEPVPAAPPAAPTPAVGQEIPAAVSPAADPFAGMVPMSAAPAQPSASPSKAEDVPF